MAATGLWVALILLVALGIASVALRWAFPADAAAQAEPLRDRIFAMLHLATGAMAERRSELARFDGRYQAHPIAVLAHIVPGGIFIALLPVQLSRPIRARFPALHRWTGRLLVTLTVVIGAAALFFGIGMPFAGPAEAILVTLIAAWFFTALIRAYAAIRRGDVASHREWMLRAVAIVVGISVVRVVGAVTDLTLTPAGFSPTSIFVVAIWTGWPATIAVCEWWIRHTRPQPA